MSVARFKLEKAVQSYLCGDVATENSLINIAKRPRHEAFPTNRPRPGMSVADTGAAIFHGVVAGMATALALTRSVSFSL
jgi:hypothetical protein